MAAFTTIDNPELYYQTKIYTGSGGDVSLTFDGDEDMAPGLLWIKQRNDTANHQLHDSVRGITKGIHSNLSNAEYTDTDAITAFNADGWSMNNNYTSHNYDGATYAAFCWKESATSGFDIVGFTGNDSARTISHSLSAVPHFYIVKARSRVANGQVFHHKLSGAGATHVLYLPTTHGEQDETMWNDTAPTSSVFSVSGGSEVNDDGETYIAYLWAAKQGFSKFGQYDGNGDANGTFVYTGFRPAFVMTKSIDSTSSWHMFDNKREGYNVDNDPLVADDTTAEATTDMIDLLSNGFKFRIATDPNVAETYVYMAFAEAPFVNSNGVPCNAR